MSYLKNKLCLVSLKKSMTALRDEFQKKLLLKPSNLSQTFYNHSKHAQRFIFECLSLEKPLGDQAVLNNQQIMKAIKFIHCILVHHNIPTSQLTIKILNDFPECKLEGQIIETLLKSAGIRIAAYTSLLSLNIETQVSYYT